MVTCSICGWNVFIVFNGLTIISNPATDPLNPLLTYGAHGLDLGTGMANVNATLYYDISNLSLGAVGDGVPDIMLTQIAQTSPLVTHTIAFFDAFFCLFL